MSDRAAPESVEDPRFESCRTIAWKIGPFVDGELPASERDAVEAHFAKCKECAAAAVEFRNLDSLASSGKVPAVTGAEWARVWEGIIERSKHADEDSIIVSSRFARARRWLVPAFAAAAVFVAGAFFGTSFMNRTSTPDVVRQTKPNADRVKTEDFAAKRSGHAPVIEVEDDVIFFDYPDF